VIRLVILSFFPFFQSLRMAGSATSATGATTVKLSTPKAKNVSELKVPTHILSCTVTMEQSKYTTVSI
jgi:hypothetical protein